MTGHADGTVCFWDVSAPIQTRQCISAPLRLAHELRVFMTTCLEGDAPDPPAVTAAQCVGGTSKTGLLALGFRSGEMIVFRLADRTGFEEVWRTSVHSTAVVSIALAPDAMRIVSRGEFILCVPRGSNVPLLLVPLTNVTLHANPAHNLLTI